MLLLALMLAAAAPDYLLVNQAEIDAARQKAEKHAWARAALNDLVANAERALKRGLDIPSRGGQWPHWYSCSKDGARLVTDSPTRHRCPVCNTIYSGDPFDAVVLYGVHSRNAQATRDLGLAFRFTGRTEFAGHAAKILLGYADRYRSYPRHNTRGEDRVGGGKMSAQTLDESVWLIPMTWSYALVRDTLTAEERAQVENDLLIPAAEVIREHRMGIHNIQCWKNSAVGLAGFVTGRKDLVEEAINDPERGFRSQIAKGVTDDGLWWEGSVGYHQYTVQALWPLAEAARRQGIDLFTERYSRMYDAPLALAFPNGDSPGFNDNAGGNVLRGASLYELAFARWKKPEFGRLVAGSSRSGHESLLYGAEEVPSGPMIPEASVLMKSAGFAVLRAGPTVAAVRFGMHGGGHGHPDKLNLVTFGGGRNLGLDPGSINYGVPLHSEWYRSTIAHNTVSVDQQLQANADGTLDEWTVKGGLTTLAATAAKAYPGVTLKRTVKLSAGRIEDRFECASDTEHTYDWAFHVAGTLTTSLKLEPQTAPLGKDKGYQHVTGVARGKTGGAWWVRWDADGAILTLRFEAAPDTEVITGAGPGRDPRDKVPLVIVRRRAAKTVFAATHEIAR
ncbi:MAG: heparinase II/III family protein [Acidobacteria bacterium]|nr:heparinase II/III family protein [Acidobacteriota bacterium]